MIFGIVEEPVEDHVEDVAFYKIIHKALQYFFHIDGTNFSVSFTMDVELRISSAISPNSEVE